MKKKMSMLSRKTIIVNELGLHARPAAIIAKIAREAEGTVRLIANERTVNAASMIDILTLSCSKNTEIEISITQKIDMKILKKIEEVIKSGFGE